MKTGLGRMGAVCLVAVVFAGALRLAHDAAVEDAGPASAAARGLMPVSAADLRLRPAPAATPTGAPRGLFAGLARGPAAPGLAGGARLGAAAGALSLAAHPSFRQLRVMADDIATPIDRAARRDVVLRDASPDTTPGPGPITVRVERRLVIDIRFGDFLW